MSSFRGFWKQSLSEEKQSEVVEAFNLKSRYLDDLLNIDNAYFDGFISQFYPSELQLNKANSSEAQALFLDLQISILDGFIVCLQALSFYHYLFSFQRYTFEYSL